MQITKIEWKGKWIQNNAESVNFTILLGDLTDNGLAYEFDNVTKRLNKLDKPFYPVIGNHDKSEGAWVTEWAELG